MPIVSIPYQQLCNSSGKSLTNLIPLDSKENLLLGWGQSCGVYMIKIDDSSKIIYKNIIKDGSKVQSIFQQQNSSTIWVIQKDKITVYSFNGFFSFTETKSMSYGGSTGSYIEQIQLIDLEVILLVYQREIQFIETHNQVVLTSKFQIKDTEASISSLMIVNNKFMFLSQDQDINVIEYLELNPKSDSITLKYDCTIFSSYKASPNKIVLLNNSTFALQTKTSGLYFGSYENFLKSRNCSDISFQYFVQDKRYLEMRYLQSNKDKSYLIAEELFNSIKIIQLDNTSSFVQRIYQVIPIKQKTSDLKFSNDNSYIVQITENQLDLYKKVSSNYQNKIPSIISINDYIIANQFTQSAKISWRCKVDKDLLYYSKGTDGVIIFKRDPINYTLMLESIIKIDSGQHDLAVPIQNTTNLIVGDNKLYFIDMKDSKKPVIQSNWTFGFPSIDANFAVVSQNQTTLFVAAGQPGLLIINITDYKLPTLVSQIQYTTPILANSINLQTYLNDSYVFVSYRNLGIIVYDVRNISQPAIESLYPISAGDDLRISSDGKFMVVSNREQGIQILDITDLKNIVQISNLFIQGSTYRVYLIANDNYVLTSSILNGQLQLIDIRNLQSPKVLQTYQYNLQDFAFDICLTSDQNKGYLALGDGVLFFNLFTNRNFNVNFLDLSNQDIIQNKNLDNEFLIGQIIGIKITEIFPAPERKLIITNIYFYNSFFQIEKLPSWAQFIQGKQLLILQLQKEALIQQYGRVAEQKQFIFELKEKLFDTDFTYTAIGITTSLSQSIFLLCQQNEIVDQQQYVVKFKQNLITYIFKTYTVAQVNHILSVLQQKVISYPVQILVKSSLYYNDQSNILSTLSDDVTVQISSNVNDGVFVNDNYQGVIVNYSEMKEIVTTKGNLVNINKMMQSQFRFANLTNPQNIKLKIVIDDHLNYQQIIDVDLMQAKFIRLNKPTSISNKKSLQQDFNSKNSGSSISILSTFQYTFDSSVFVDDDDQTLSYSAYILVDSEYIPIPQDFWIIFQRQDRTFFGSTSPNQYNEKVIILVNSTDGYTYAEDTFEINVDILPPYYVMTILLEVLLPILFCILCWNYKSILINHLRKSQLKNAPIHIDLDRQYYIQIPILEYCMEEGLTIWKKYKYTIIKEIVLREITFLKLQKQFPQTQRNTQNDKESINDTQNYLNVPSSLNTPLAQSTIKLNSDKNVQKGMMTFSQKIVKNMGDGQVKQIVKHLKEKSNYNTNCFIYLQSDGSLNYKSILDSIYQWCKINYNKPKVLNDLQKSGSLLCHVMIGLISRQFAQIDKTTETVIQILKQNALKDGYLENEWYKSYVEFVTDEEIILQSPVPKLYYNQIRIDEQLNIIKQLQSSIQHSEFILPLIKENLKAIAYGFTPESRSFWPINRKECIDCYSHQISCIKAYRPFQRQSYFNKKKFVEVEKEKELSTNSLLPSWINSVDIINGSLFFAINAQVKDQGKYQIKVLSTSSIVLKVIFLNIGNTETSGEQTIKEDQDQQQPNQSSQYKSQYNNENDLQYQQDIQSSISKQESFQIANMDQNQQLDSPQPLQVLKKTVSQYYKNENHSGLLSNSSIHKKNSSKTVKLDSRQSWRDQKDDLSENCSSQRQVGGENENLAFDHYQNSPKLSPFYQIDQKLKFFQNQTQTQKSLFS